MSAFGGLFMSRSPSPSANAGPPSEPSAPSAPSAAAPRTYPAPAAPSAPSPADAAGGGAQADAAAGGVQPPQRPPQRPPEGSARELELCRQGKRAQYDDHLDCVSPEAAAAALLMVPPQPTPATRMPRRSRGLDSESTSSIGSGSSCASSLPGTPASVRQLPPGAGISGAHAGVSDKSQAGWWAALLPSSLEEDEKVARAAEPSSSSADYLRKAQAHKMRKTAKVRDSGYGDYCCFRDSHLIKTSKCGQIREDSEQTEFDDDVMVLKLKSILRRHGVEPGGALVGDLLDWQDQAVEQAQLALPPAASRGSQCEGGTGGPPGSARSDGWR